MKSIMMCFLLLAGLTAGAQSKKELLKENEKLRADLRNAQARIDSLTPKPVDLVQMPQRACYSLGVIIGTNIAMQEMDSIDVDNLVAGLTDALQEKDLKIQTGEAQQIVQQYIERANESRNRKAIEKEAAFLENNRKQPGVQTTPSGLQYRVVKEGTGKSPAATSNVTVHYTGKLLDGSVFDSSVERGQPATFNLNQVIPGWTEALQLMKEGGKSIIYLPYSLGYGERGGGQIPPFSTLIFEVELIKIN